MHRPCSDSERFGRNHLFQFQFFGGACSSPDASKCAPFKAEEGACWIFSLCEVSELESPSETLYLLHLSLYIFASLSNTRKSEVIRTGSINQKKNVPTFRSLNFFLLLLIKRVTGNDKREKWKMGTKQKTVNEVTVRAGFKLGFVPIFHIPVPVLVPYYPFPVLVTSLSNIAWFLLV